MDTSSYGLRNAELGQFCEYSNVILICTIDKIKTAVLKNTRNLFLMPSMHISVTLIIHRFCLDGAILFLKMFGDMTVFVHMVCTYDTD